LTILEKTNYDMILLLIYKEQSSKCERQEGYKCFLILKQLEHFSQSPPQFFFQNTKSTLVYYFSVPYPRTNI